MKVIRTVIIVLCIAAIIFGVWKMFSIQFGYYRGGKTYEKLEEYVSLPAAPADSSPAPGVSKPETTPTATEEPQKEKIDFPVVDFESLQKINPDILGWIYCEGTAINYPLVQGKDNDYYLDHLFDNTQNSSGAIFLDKRNNRAFSDPNSIIYGHNMQNGTMFAAISEYKEQSFFDEHPRFLLMTPVKNYTMDIFAGLITSETDNIWQIDFADDPEFERWLTAHISQSSIETGILPAVTDHVVTLSTCSYEYEGARFVVMCILNEA